MIKTIQYNDFSGLSSDIIYNKDLLIEEIKNFHENNGNLNYDIKANSYDKLVHGEQWLREKIKDPATMNYLFENGYLESPFEWKVENAKIIENPLYGGYWYRDNKEFYMDYMNTGVVKLLEHISQHNIEPVSYVETTYEKKLKEVSYQHPIIYLANKLENPKVYDTIFTMRPEYKQLWLEESAYKESQPNYIYSIGLHNSRTIDSGIAKVFYEHGILTDFLHNPENSQYLKAVIKTAIIENDIEFIKKYIHEWDIPTLEKEDDRSYCFLVCARNKEMAQLLLDNGAFVMGQLKSTDKYETSIFPSEYLTNQEVLETILDFKEEYRNLVVTHSKAIYDRYFTSKYENLIKMFINKYNFPVEQHDLLKIGRDLHGTDGMKWALNLGADPKNCEELITYCVSAREDGLSFLKKVHKEGSFNVFQPDAIHNLLQSNPTKIFYTWLSKAPTDNFLAYTKEGKPAWWTTNLTSLEVIAKKVKNFNQLDNNGNNFFHNISSLKGFKDELITTVIEKGHLSSEELAIILNQTNQKGISAMENILSILKNPNKQNDWGIKNTVKNLIKYGQDHIDFNLKTQSDITLYEELCTIFPDFTDLNIYYQKHILERKIPQKISSSNSKLKI